MAFEFDPAKSALNKDKHGLDFLEAQVLWDDEHMLLLPARKDQEPRFMAIGRMDGRHWSAIFVYRGDAIRIISVRRSRKQEIDIYESV